jgi:hypothetical protein
VLPITHGLEIKPSKTPQPFESGTLSPKLIDKPSVSPNRRKNLKAGANFERPTTVPDPPTLLDHASFKKPGTSMGSTTNHFLRSTSGLDQIEENVVYQ